ncbi:MAG: hypothetical protein AAGA56_22220 [Myxococcota bacterium]
MACLDRPVEPVATRTTSTFTRSLAATTVDKLDILLVVDNSGSMGDKQEILAEAVPDLVGTLVNPGCVNEMGVPVAFAGGPLDPCPAGATREFPPILDVHIGVITTSLGGSGSDTCTEVDDGARNDDRGRLISRADVDASDGTVDTYVGPGGNSLGFLAWDPGATKTPVGEADEAALFKNLTALVKGAGETGCGFEATLESWYRFLVDPDPYASLRLNDDGRIALEGTDRVLLEQRHNFLRSDSLLAILMLSDENDCSIQPAGRNYLVANTDRPMAKSSPTCAVDPQDRCCFSCDVEPPSGCEACTGHLSANEDKGNLRCWDQKRRFGFDFTYPVERYVNGLREPEVPTRNGDLVPNPLYTSRNGAVVRGADLVFLAGIVGVPWQSIARRGEDGEPDLNLGFQNAEELRDTNTWAAILGDPSCRRDASDPDDDCQPSDPRMRESSMPRTGGADGGGSLGAVGAFDSALANGAEWKAHLTPNGDLQYACIFDLVSPQPNGVDCRDEDGTFQNPLCFNDGSDPAFPPSPESDYGTVQFRAKAYPGLRQLEALRGMGSTGIVGSICPVTANPADKRLENGNQNPLYGYRPAVRAIVDRLSAEFRQCLPRTLSVDERRQVSCRVVESFLPQGDVACGAQCTALRGRSGPRADDPLVLEASNRIAATGRDANGRCFCEIEQLADDALSACQQEASVPRTNGEPVHGFCYVDATTAPPTGNQAIVADCPTNRRRKLRFTGEAPVRAGAETFISCAGD